MEILIPVIKLMTYIGIGLIAIGILAIRGIFRGCRSKFNYFFGAIICFGLGIFFLTMKSSGSIKVTEDSLILKVMLSKTQIIETDKIERAWVDDLQESEWCLSAEVPALRSAIFGQDGTGLKTAGGHLSSYREREPFL